MSKNQYNVLFDSFSDMMKYGLLIGGILLIGAMLGYVIFLMMGGNQSDIFDYGSSSNFQNTIIHTNPASSPGGSSFQTQGFTSRPAVINK